MNIRCLCQPAVTDFMTTCITNPWPSATRCLQLNARITVSGRRILQTRIADTLSNTMVRSKPGGSVEMSISGIVGHERTLITLYGLKLEHAVASLHHNLHSLIGC